MLFPPDLHEQLTRLAERHDVDAARELLDRHDELTAHDALHGAVALRTGAAAICSYDGDLDAIDGVTRIEPEISSSSSA